MNLKKLTGLLLTAAALPVLALAGVQNFAGTWMLDKAQSKNLSPQRQGIVSHKLTITQDAQRMNVDIAIESGRPEIPPIKQLNSYQLDGAEVTAETEIFTPKGPLKVPTTLQAVPQSDGSLAVTITRAISRNGETVKRSMQEHWTLSADGKAITIHLKEEQPRGGTHESDLVFVRQG